MLCAIVTFFSKQLVFLFYEQGRIILSYIPCVTFCGEKPFSMEVGLGVREGSPWMLHSPALKQVIFFFFLSLFFKGCPKATN